MSERKHTEEKKEVSKIFYFSHLIFHSFLVFQPIFFSVFFPNYCVQYTVSPYKGKQNNGCSVHSNHDKAFQDGCSQYITGGKQPRGILFMPGLRATGMWGSSAWVGMSGWGKNCKLHWKWGNKLLEISDIILKRWVFPIYRKRAGFLPVCGQFCIVTGIIKQSAGMMK